MKENCKRQFRKTAKKERFMLKRLIELHRKKILQMKQPSPKFVQKFLNELFDWASTKQSLRHARRVIQNLSQFPLNPKVTESEEKSSKRETQKEGEAQSETVQPESELNAKFEKELMNKLSQLSLHLSDAELENLQNELTDPETVETLLKHNLSVKDVMARPFLSKLFMDQSQLRSTLHEVYKKTSFLSLKKKSSRDIRRLNSPNTEKYLHNIKALRKYKSFQKSDIFEDKVLWWKNQKKLREVKGRITRKQAARVVQIPQICREKVIFFAKEAEKRFLRLAEHPILRCRAQEHLLSGFEVLDAEVQPLQTQTAPEESRLRERGQAPEATRPVAGVPLGYEQGPHHFE